MVSLDPYLPLVGRSEYSSSNIPGGGVFVWGLPIVMIIPLGSFPSALALQSCGHVTLRFSISPVDGATLFLRSGFLRPREVSVGRSEVASVRLRRSLPQRLFGGGAIDVKTLSGEHLFVTDLDHPARIVAALSPQPRDAFGHEERLK